MDQFVGQAMDQAAEILKKIDGQRKRAREVLGRTCPITGLDALLNPWVFTSVERNS
jgi:hypothetical protein